MCNNIDVFHNAYQKELDTQKIQTVWFNLHEILIKYTNI